MLVSISDSLQLIYLDKNAKATFKLVGNPQSGSAQGQYELSEETKRK